MLRKVSALLLILGATAAMAVGPTGESRVPDVIESEVPGVPPAWVAANIALAPDGNLRSHLFLEASISTIRNYFNEKARQSTNTTADPDECSVTLGQALEQFSSTATTDNLVSNSSYIISASVADLREGFLFGNPGTLIALDVADWLKHENDEVRQRPAYLFFPSARITTPHGTICAKPWPHVPTPAKGDQLLVFSYLGPVGINAAIFQIRPSKQLILDGPAAKYLPEAMRPKAGASLDFAETVALVRRNPGIGFRSPEREMH
jgi:hypothetical protein